ncbi:thiolase family protein [Rhodococcus sp. BP-252]|uniref:thiolase family protein n=1 Tax=unclassified Rhodococcus (in: high G+C Gram-positive bacteria) TaxID=192944 RepID=UPI001C9B1D4C|nr:MULTISPECIES: thiolase family protein [unclassified Rhodococcus (in: high G+C Gram-positive bacteria)]MBY6412832.1 thiolase family protein [Rhodococcus sp. BP-320]MBY6417631.1 thiolase family protein [Rhodococcus sp. BP-321]MBY6423483.1 thiolase family protein [Rhodococcus sp. BP-324]MBY6427655.1 thiolase family protein [Rhodococcus sp. BP-323]MBY6432819.1 thiolase family protein [Rhodococcus sp. BP-322]
MGEVFLVAGARTPQGRYGGALATVRPDDLAGIVVAEAVRRAGVPADKIDEVILGAANQAGEDNRDVARMAVLLAGLPDSVPGYTVNRLCASGLTAVANAASTIRSGEADIIVAGGVESMTRAPWVLAKPGTAWAKPGEIFDTALGWRFTNPTFAAYDAAVATGSGPDVRKITLSMGETAEEVALSEGITRDESDAFALRSQERAIAAQDAGRFVDEIVPVATKNGEVAEDETPRRGTTLEKLGKLKTVFKKDGIVTAGTSSPFTDGAAALVVASEEAVNKYGLEVRGRIVTSASAGIAPNVMGLGPVPSTQKALARAGWSVDDLDAIELNEAFAAQSLGVIRQLKLDDAKVNADGGAIALGHPLGASGARILLTLLGRMEREKASRGLATLCVGVGQGVSMLIEAP